MTAPYPEDVGSGTAPPTATPEEYDDSQPDDRTPGAVGILLYEHQSNPSRTAEERIYRNDPRGRVSALTERKDATEQEVQQTVDTTVSTAQETAEDVVQEARNVGPDYLDELTGVVVALAVVFGALYLLRPLLTIGANVSG